MPQHIEAKRCGFTDRGTLTSSSIWNHQGKPPTSVQCMDRPPMPWPSGYMMQPRRSSWRSRGALRRQKAKPDQWNYTLNRKSDVTGKSVSVRVDHGGGSTNKKKTKHIK